MDFRQIQYVEAVARHANFTRAAAELHVAQPALSHAVRRLENELQVRLFERTSRRVALTDAGEAFLALAGRISRDMDQLTSEMDEYAGGLRGRLRVSSWYHVEPRLGEFLRDYLVLHPAVEVSLSELPTPEALDLLRAGDLDLATVLIHPGLDLGGVQRVRLRAEPYVLVTPAEHPLAQREAISVDDLAGLRMIVPREGTALRRCYDRIVAGHEPQPQIAVETNELAAIVSFVAAGLGGAILTATIVHAIDRSVGLVPIADAYPFLLDAAYREGPHRSIVQHAIDLVAEHGTPPGEP